MKDTVKDLWSDKLVTIALAGVGTVGLFTLATIKPLTRLLGAAVLLLAIAIPLLGCYAFILECVERKGIAPSTKVKTIRTWYTVAIGVGGWSMGFGALTCIVWSLSTMAGWMFIGSSLLAVLTGAMFSVKLDKLQAASRSHNSDL